MTARINVLNINPKLTKGVFATSRAIKESGLDPKLLELLNYRVSQINACAFCLDMHHKELLELGEEELRLHSLPAWRECPFYSEEERAVLAFAEALTVTSTHDIPNELYDELKAFFSPEEIVVLTLAVTQINTWNRLNKVFRPVPGKYEVGQFA